MIEKKSLFVKKEVRRRPFYNRKGQMLEDKGQVEYSVIQGFISA